MPLITVVIPVYNVEHYIEKCMDSIVNQTFKDIEIILINDGSTDNSGVICEKYARQDKRIKLIHQINKGVSLARNLGLKKAMGKWIYFMDADDYLEPNTLELLANEFEPNLDVIQFGLSVIRNGEESIIEGKHPPEYLKVFKKSDVFTNVIMKPLSAWLIMVRKSVLVENNIKFHPVLSYNEDSLFVFQILSNCNGVLFYNKSFYNMVVRSDSATSIPVRMNRINDKLVYLSLLIAYYRERKMEAFITKDIQSGLKSFFIDISNYCFKNKEEKKMLIREYRKFYLKNKFHMKSTFLHLGFIHINLVTALLKFRKTA